MSILIKNSNHISQTFYLALLGSVLTLALGGCATVPPPQAFEAVPPPPPPSTQVYFYPKRGQSPDQQDRDRYECYLWAKQQTGFDPSQANLAPQQRVQVTPVPAPGRDTAVGALTGAALGAAVSEPGEQGGGAVLGAITGAMIGAISDSARQQQAQRLQESYNQASAADEARIASQARDYRRAMAACLEGRGYAVTQQ